MNKKLNYLILLFTIIFTVGCTNVEDASNTKEKTDPQEVTTVTKDSEKDTTVVDEPVEEESPTQPINELFPG